mgnify:CR=1 FL=1
MKFEDDASTSKRLSSVLSADRCEHCGDFIGEFYCIGCGMSGTTCMNAECAYSKMKSSHGAGIRPVIHADIYKGAFSSEKALGKGSLTTALYQR